MLKLEVFDVVDEMIGFIDAKAYKNRKMMSVIMSVCMVSTQTGKYILGHNN